jgi:DNA modification methylase
MRWIVEKLPLDCIVLDPYMGSASTGAACLETGRSFIGIESHPGYFATAKRRLAAVQPQLSLTLAP